MYSADSKKPDDGNRDIQKPNDGDEKIQEPSAEGGNIQKPNDGDQKIQEPSAEVGNIQKPNDGDEKMQEPSDEGGNIQKPNDGDEKRQEPSDEVGSIQKPNDGDEKMQEPSDEGGNIQKPNDGDEKRQEPSDEVGSIQKPNDGDEKMQEPSDEGGNIQKPNDGEEKRQEPSDEVGSIQKPNDGDEKIQEPSDEVGSIQKPNDGDEKRQEPSDEVGNIQKPNDGDEKMQEPGDVGGNIIQKWNDGDEKMQEPSDVGRNIIQKLKGGYGVIRISKFLRISRWYLMKMAKPERHLWPYSPQWNYYPPHVLNFPKLPYPNGHGHHQINPNSNENYLPIRCPEPRRPYQVPYAPFDSYSHQGNHPVHGTYGQHNSFYPKQYVHRPIPHDNSNNSFKLNETIHSYPACSKNFSETKDQRNSYQTAWKNTSHRKKKTPVLDVRKFLATWQEKDDDLLDVSSETEENRTSQSYESTPLDCTKRINSEKNVKPHYESSMIGPSNPTGCVVQPYYIKDNNVPMNRSIVSSGEMNNNIPQRNNLNYSNINHHSYNKNYYSHSDHWKATNNKMLSCEHSVSYSQQYNHCDVNSFRNNFNCMRPKENLDSSDRSQYNLTSSLETGDLFCDINSHNDESQKQQIIHPFFNDVHHRPIGCDEQPYYNGSYNNDYSESLVYTDLHAPKESWDLFSSSVKCNDRFGNLEKHKLSHSKGSVHPYHNQLDNTNLSNGNPIVYEGAFNILTNSSDSDLPITNSVQYSNINNNLPLQSIESSKLATSPALTSNKILPNTPKCTSGSGKIKPYNFAEEVSSDDIDISIASSGDLLVDEDHPGLGPISVISFSRSKKEKLCNPTTADEIHNENKSSSAYSEPIHPEHSVNIPKNNTFNQTVEISNPAQTLEPENLDTTTCSQSISSKTPVGTINLSLKPDEVDLSALKPKAIEEVISYNNKENLDYLDISSNYFVNNDSDKRSIPDVINSCTENKSGPISKTDNSLTDQLLVLESVQESQISNKDSNNLSYHTSVPDSGDVDTLMTNENLLLLAHCSQEYGCQNTEEPKDQEKHSENITQKIANSENSVNSPSNINYKSPNFEDVETIKKTEKLEEQEVTEKVTDSLGFNSEHNNQDINSSISSRCPEVLTNHLSDDISQSCSQNTVGLSLPIIEDFSDSRNTTIEVQNSMHYNSIDSNDFENQETDLQKLSPKNYIEVEKSLVRIENKVEKSIVKIQNEVEKGIIKIQNEVCVKDIEILNAFNTANCSSEFGCQIAKDLNKDLIECSIEKHEDADKSEKTIKPVRDTVIKCSLRWDKIFNVMADNNNHQPDMSLDLGPAKVELRMPAENNSPGHWKIVEADNKFQTSSIVKVKRLILKRKSLSEERIPKMIIKKTEGQEYRSYLKNEPNETVLNCGKFKIFCDIPSKPKSPKNDQTVN